MALDFPASPVNGQIYDPGTGTLYQWNGSQWDVVTVPVMVIRQQVFLVNGTYVPHPAMVHAIIETVGGGGAGGGVTGSASNQTNSSGGGGGAYSKKYVTRADIGASKAVVVGAGAPAVPGNADGGSGGLSSVGTLCLANGGGGGGKGQSGVAISSGGLGGNLAGAIGDLCWEGGDGGGGQGSTNNYLFSGFGGGNVYAGQRRPPLANSGTAGKFPGGGGTGAQSLGVSSYNGGPGANGVVIITEYCAS